MGSRMASGKPSMVVQLLAPDSRLAIRFCALTARKTVARSDFESFLIALAAQSERQQRKLVVD